MNATNNNNIKYVNQRSIWSAPKNIIPVRRVKEHCPKCNRKLIKDTTQIPVSDNKWAEVAGLWCGHCDAFYVTNGNEVKNLLIDNALAKEFRYNDRELWEYTKDKEYQDAISRWKSGVYKLKEEWLKELHRLRSAVVMIAIEVGQPSRLERFTIVNDEEEEDNDYIYHYTSEEARELLTAAYADKPERNNVFENEPYKINMILGLDQDESLPGNVITTNAIIQKGGGYYSPKNSELNLELVDTLIYSPKTERYELIPATFDRRNGNCFIDIQLYREFVYEHGKPELEIEFNKVSSKSTRFEDLESESILTEWGYSVSTQKKVSEQTRRKYLMEIVDLEILTVHRIVNHLGWCCKYHPLPKDALAREKWQSDIEFIQGYRVNPERFLIADWPSKP